MVFRRDGDGRPDVRRRAEGAGRRALHRAGRGAPRGGLLGGRARGAARRRRVVAADPGRADPAEIPAKAAPAASPAAAAAPSAAPDRSSPDAILATIERLADLHARGVLTDAEFATKKTELLARL
ncbi:SHOCT domain-containing protein [Methylobacterium oryzae]|uniref:SHOCT domain-containing protein n=1 Tax=Methylobacterium oryzae TaxID=334852 RepID=UPI003AF998F2